MRKIRVREDILRIKSLISEPRNLRVRDDLEELLTQLRDLGYRVEEIEKKLASKGSTVEARRRSQIISLLRSKSMTSQEVGKAMRISRTRASEYLNALEKEGVVVSKRIDRRKYYSLKGGSE